MCLIFYDCVPRARNVLYATPVGYTVHIILLTVCYNCNKITEVFCIFPNIDLIIRVLKMTVRPCRAWIIQQGCILERVMKWEKYIQFNIAPNVAAWCICLCALILYRALLLIFSPPPPLTHTQGALESTLSSVVYYYAGPYA